MTYGLNLFDANGKLALNTDYMFANKIAEVTRTFSYGIGPMLVTCPIPYVGRLGAIATATYKFVTSGNPQTINVEYFTVVSNSILVRELYPDPSGGILKVEFFAV